MLRFHLREREHARLALFALRTYASKLLVWRLRLARRSTAVHRGRRPSRWCNGLRFGMDRLELARQRAHTSEARVLRFLLRDRERARLALFDLRTYATKLLVWRSQLARRSKAVHRGRRPSRWRSGLFIRYGPTSISAAGCEHVAGARAALHPQRERVRAVGAFLPCART